MGLFSSSTGYLGVDIGNSSIKVVELLSEKGRPKLATYGFSEQVADLSKNDSPEVQAKTAKIIRKICKEARTKSLKVTASLPSFTVFSSVISLPRMPKKDLASAIKWEAKKVIPLPLEEIILDWRILEEDEKEEGGKTKQAPAGNARKKNIKLLLTGAGKGLVRNYMKIIKMAGLTLSSLEPESFALIRSLVGHDRSTIIIIDLGASATNISIIEEGIPLLNRSIDVGGRAVTQSIAGNLNVSNEQAEQFKKDVGMSNVEESSANLPEAVGQSVSAIVNEIKYTIGLYQNQKRGSVEKIILTGGSAMLSGLPFYLSNVLDIKSFIGDPWARVVYPVELKPILNEIGSKMSVAVGLAMRDIG